MAFNYNTNPVNIDLGGIAALGNLRERRLARETEEEERKRKLAKEATEAQFTEHLMRMYNQNPNQNLMQLEESVKLAASNFDQWKKVHESLGGVSEERKEMMYDSAYGAWILGRDGNWDMAKQGLLERADLLDQYGQDSSHTREIINLIDKGEYTKAEELLEAFVATGVNTGYIQGANPKEFKRFAPAEIDGRVKLVSYNEYKQHIDDLGAAPERGRKGADGKDKDKENEPPKLTSTQLTRIGELRDNAKTYMTDYSKAESLSDRLLEMSKDAGFFDMGIGARVQDTVRGVLGEETPETLLRKEQKQFTNRSVINTLRGTGAISNFEFKTVQSGLPTDTTNPLLLSDYMYKTATMARLNANLDTIESQFLERTGNINISSRNTTLRIGGETLEVKRGDSLEDVQAKWLEKENEREGKRLAEREKKKSKYLTDKDFEEMYKVD